MTTIPTYEELQAENKRLREKVSVLESAAVDIMVCEDMLAEARRWARQYRRKYLHVKANILRESDTYKNVSLRSLLPLDDDDSIPF